MRILKSIIMVAAIVGLTSACKNLEKAEDALSLEDNQELVSEFSEVLNITTETEPVENVAGIVDETALTADEIAEDEVTISLRKTIREIRGLVAEEIAECAGIVTVRAHRLDMRSQVDALGENPTEEAKAALAVELKAQRELFKQTMQDKKQEIEECYAAQEDSDLFDALSDVKEFCPVKKGALKKKRFAKKNGTDQMSQSDSSMKKLGRKDKMKRKHAKSKKKSMKRSKKASGESDLNEMFSKLPKSKNFDSESCQASLVTAAAMLN